MLILITRSRIWNFTAWLEILKIEYLKNETWLFYEIRKTVHTEKLSFCSQRNLPDFTHCIFTNFEQVNAGWEIHKLTLNKVRRVQLYQTKCSSRTFSWEFSKLFIEAIFQNIHRLFKSGSLIYRSQDERLIQIWR